MHWPVNEHGFPQQLVLANDVSYSLLTHLIYWKSAAGPLFFSRVYWRGSTADGQPPLWRSAPGLIPDGLANMEESELMTWTFWRCFSFIFGELSDCSCFLQSLAEISRLLSVVLSLFLYKDMKSQLSKLTWFLHKKPRCVASGLQYSWGLWMARLSWFHLCLPLAPGRHYCGFQTLI